MKRAALTHAMVELSARPHGTVRDYFDDLRDAGAITRGTRGRYGGATMNATDRVILLLGTALDRPRGMSVVSSVVRWRSFPLASAEYNPLGSRMSPEDNTRCALQFVQGLGIKLDDVGTALDGIVESMQTGAFRDWAAGAQVTVSADFHADHEVMLALDRPQFNQSAIFRFASDESEGRQAGIERIVRINRAAFERLAAESTT